jgi:hypothetical protein
MPTYEQVQERIGKRSRTWRVTDVAGFFGSDPASHNTNVGMVDCTDLPRLRAGAACVSRRIVTMEPQVPFSIG